MRQRPPDSDDPTSEEQAPEFDGTATVQLDDTYRLRVVTAGNSANDPVGVGAGIANAKDATDQLRALENPALNAATRERKPLTEPGGDPDATGVFVKPKIDP